MLNAGESTPGLLQETTQWLYTHNRSANMHLWHKSYLAKMQKNPKKL